MISQNLLSAVASILFTISSLNLPSRTSFNDAKQKNVTMQGWTARPLSFFQSGFAEGSTMVLRCLAMFLFVKRTPSLIGHLRRSQIGLGNLRADPNN